MSQSQSKNGANYPEPIAIVGMSCIFPGAPSITEFWNNIIDGVDCVREATPEEWDAEFYRNKTGFGQIYCTRGGFITEYSEFNPLEFGIMPASLRGADPDQFICLKAAADALRDAGYNPRTFDGEKAEVVIGRTMAPGAGSLNLIQHGQTVDQVLEILRITCPRLTDEQLELVAAKLKESLNPCSADTIPAVMPNVLSGRIANKLGFRGRNLVLDAACASSLVAVEEGIHRLLSGHADLILAGGVHLNSHPYFYQMFCELGALSPSEQIRPFDENADGTILGEGVGMVVLKRLSDALNDQDRVYAVIKGIGSASDGSGGGSLAPNISGEALAMERAYNMAGVSPRTVQLLEAHGTGTALGDVVEMKAVQQVFQSEQFAEAPENLSNTKWCALGSVKSMIGHTQAASGMAGLIKVALSLYNRVLPPTINVNRPNSKIDWQNSPCYINTAANDWHLDEAADHPRRAAVSAFGFGGVNAHAVLEEFHFVKNAPIKTVVAVSPAAGVRLSLKYPCLSASALRSICFENSRRTHSHGITISSDQEVHDEDFVMHSHLQNMGIFQNQLLDVQESIVLSFLSQPSAVEVEDFVG